MIAETNRTKKVHKYRFSAVFITAQYHNKHCDENSANSEVLNETADNCRVKQTLRDVGQLIANIRDGIRYETERQYLNHQ